MGSPKGLVGSRLGPGGQFGVARKKVENHWARMTRCVYARLSYLTRVEIRCLLTLTVKADFLKGAVSYGLS